MKYLSLSALVFLLFSLPALAQQPYPFPVHYFVHNVQGQQAKMAYMDVIPTHPNGHTAILFHGKNFNGYYWKDVASFLSDKGYRVIIPDQIGWGKSDKPVIYYSFSMLASNNKALLDTLGIGSVIVIGHSMGGMLATRFSLMYPDAVEKLVLENPIGLEDYKTFVPYTSFEQQYKTELSATYDSYKKYMESYFPIWKPEYDEMVKQQAAALKDPEFAQTARVNALTYQMIYDQPVCYEFANLRCKTLLIIGQADRTIVGKDKLTKEQQQTHGQYPELGRRTHTLIKNSSLKEIDSVGHIPHIQQPKVFKNELEHFLNE